MRAVLAIVFWWIVLAGLWLLYVGQHTKENAVAGVVAAALAVGFGALLARLGLYRFELDPRWLGRAVTIPWYVLRDFGLLTAALLRGRPQGRFTEMDVPAAVARSPGSRAALGLLGSVAPNAYVVDFDRDRNAALVHELDPARSKERPL